MRTRTVAALVAALAVSSPATWGAPCSTACKDEIKSCATQQCAGLKPAAKMRCKRSKCQKPIVNDCYHDLNVCGATTARAPHSPAPTSGGW
jgi:hypothetical protein